MNSSRSCLTLTPPLRSWCGGGGQSQQFDQRGHTDGHVPDRSHHWDHRAGLARPLLPPPLHRAQEKAEEQRAQHACGDLLPCYEGPCRLHHLWYVIIHLPLATLNTHNQIVASDHWVSSE